METWQHCSHFPGLSQNCCAYSCIKRGARCVASDMLRNKLTSLKLLPSLHSLLFTFPPVNFGSTVSRFFNFSNNSQFSLFYFCIAQWTCILFHLMFLIFYIPRLNKAVLPYLLPFLLTDISCCWALKNMAEI